MNKIFFLLYKLLMEVY